MKTVSEALKSAREKKGVDIREISDILKIREKYIVALEEGDYSIFPSPLYIKGFLTNYARYLKLDEEQILALYRREHNVNKDKKAEGLKINFEKPKRFQSINFSIKPNYIISLTVFVIVVVVLGYLWYQFRIFSTPPILRVDSPTDRQEVNTDKITISGTTQAGDTISIGSTQVDNLQSDGSFNLEYGLHAGENNIVITAFNPFNKQSTVMKRVVFFNKDESSISASKDRKMSGNINIKGGSGSWVQIIEDGETSFRGILSKGQGHSLSANSIIKITTGDAVNTSIVVNNQPIKLGKGVVTKTIEVDISGNIIVN